MITLTNILNSPKQEIFNKCSEHLLKQNRKSIAESVGCLYRDDNGLTCAIGCFITEEEYNPDMEVMPLLMALQAVHDNHDVEDWEISLKEVAEEFSLKIKK